MTRSLLVGILALGLTMPALADKRSPDPVARGQYAVHHTTGPFGLKVSSFHKIWKQWGLKKRPADFGRQIQLRYGLNPALGKNDGLPLGLKVLNTGFIQGIGFNCLLCHSGRVAGQTVVGLGNSALDLESLFEDIQAGEFIKAPDPGVRMARGRGIIEAVGANIAMFQYRDKDLNLRPFQKLTTRDDLCEDIPAWWHLHRKKTLYHTGNVYVEARRIGLSFLVANPLNSAAYIKSQESTFADMREYIRTLRAPQYPFAIDQKVVERGRKIFRRNCSRCHGTYGKKSSYPNKVIPLKSIGTDPNLVSFQPEKDLKYYEENWLYTEKRANGELMIRQTDGYQAPPLHGVWASAPYFHNASVPTLYHVLNSKARPKIFTRTFGTEREDYDTRRVGWKISVLKKHPKNLTKYEERKIYDTTESGKSNGGHTFGDRLTEPQRMALIEYLKTL